MEKPTRREFLASTTKLVAGAVALGTVSTVTAEEHKHMMEAGEGHVLDANKENTCVTCQFWGGMRKVSKDKQQVIAQSMGWCNNPNSPNHMKMTMADRVMKKPDIWVKWAAL